jgi:hypothetical protein
MADEQHDAPGADDVAEASRALGLGAQPPAPAQPGAAEEWRSTANEPAEANDEPADSPESGEEPAESDERLSEAEVALSLSRPAEMRAYIEAQQEEEAAAREIEELQSGERVGQIVQATEAYEGAIGQLIEQNPGLTNPEAIQQMEGPFETMRELYGDEIAMSPEVIRQVYEQVGGEAEFGTDPTEAQYERALRRVVPNRFGL